MNFPRLMFRSPGPEQCQGGSYTHRLVHNEEQFDAGLQDGFHDTLPQALAPEPVSETAYLLEMQGNAHHLETSIAQANAGQVQPRELVEGGAPVDLTQLEQTAPATYDEMKAQAKKMGLEFQGNISKAALLAMITAKLAEQV